MVRMTSLPGAGSTPAERPTYWQPARRSNGWVVALWVVAGVLAALLVIGGLATVAAFVLFYIALSNYGSNK
jgi:hypothetical protein